MLTITDKITFNKQIPLQNGVTPVLHTAFNGTESGRDSRREQMSNVFFLHAFPKTKIKLVLFR